MSKEKSFKIKEKLLKGKESEKDVEIKIRTKDEKEAKVNFEKLEKDKEAKEEVDFEYKKKTNDKWDENWTSFRSKIKWNGGIVTNGMKLSNQEIGGVKIEKDISVPMGFWKTPTIWSWMGLVVILIAIIALIWWWIASSNKEDKEEESL